MQSYISVPENMAKELLGVYDNKIEISENKISEGQRELQEYTKLKQELIDLLNKSASANDVMPINGDYYKGWTMFRKIVYLINKYGKPLSTKDMVDILISDYEPELLPERTKFVSSVSGVLSAKTKEGKLKRSENRIGEFVYYLSQEENETTDDNKTTEPLAE